MKSSTKDRGSRQQEEAEHSLYQAIATIRNAEEAQQFLEDLCTPAERQAMADRWQVVEPLMAETPYREIYELTGVSITTIGRVARCISLGTGGYELIYKRCKKNENQKTSHSATKKRTTQR